MPLPRPLLQLCALLLIVFAATAAHAAAPPYEVTELDITIEHKPKTVSRFEHQTACTEKGGVLLPMVTEAVYEKTLSQMNSWNIQTAVGYMGASTMLSNSSCNTSTASLDCIWYWDEGRYARKDNAVAFFEGNRHPDGLPQARMVSLLVRNYWRTGTNVNEKYPGTYMQRYGMAVRAKAALGWADSGASSWSYSWWVTPEYYTFCAIDLSVPSTTTTTTSDPNARKSTGLSVGAIVGIAAGCAVAVGVIIALVVCLARNGRCCSAGSTAVAESAYAHESCCAASQRGDMSRANSCRSCHSGYGDFSNRSFHDGAASRAGCSRRSSFHGGAGAAEASVWQNDCEMMSVVGSHYSRAPSQMMMQPQPPTFMYGNGQAVEAPMPVSVYTTEQSGAEMQRRCSNVNPAMCDMSDTDDAHAVAAVSA